VLDDGVGMSHHETSDVDHPSGSRGEWKLLPLLLIPMACCGLPLIVATLATAGALAWSLGLVAAGLVGAASAAIIVSARRRSSCSTGASRRRDHAIPPADRA
jgi:hypothetical protein